MRAPVFGGWIAFGGGAWRYTDEQVLAGYRVGLEVGGLGRNLITGATKGIPYAAALGAQEAGALVLGVSPAMSWEEHVRDGERPLRGHDCIVFTGLGTDGRSPLMLRSAPGAIFVGGEMGTLLEFCSGWLTGNRVLGILRGSGGVSDSLGPFLEGIQSGGGTTLVEDDDPVALTRRVCAAIDTGPALEDAWDFEPPEGAAIRELLARQGVSGKAYQNE